MGVTLHSIVALSTPPAVYLQQRLYISLRQYIQGPNKQTKKLEQRLGMSSSPFSIIEDDPEIYASWRILLMAVKKSVN